MLDRALFLLEAGFHVIPLGGYGETPPDYFIRERFDGDVDKARRQWPKSPRCSWKAFQLEAPTEQTVRHWWGMWPNANIGIATGSLVVVDGDSAESVEWIRKNLTPTPWRVKTGNGYHFYYAGNPALDIRNTADPLTKIDTRGTGGYVVAGGSRHFNGTVYEDELPDDMGSVALCDLPTLTAEDLAKIESFKHKSMGEASAVHPKQGQGNLVGFDARRYNTAATGEPVLEGGRNNAAASLTGKYLQQGLSLRDTQKLLMEWNNSNVAPLSEPELTTTIASVAKTHLSNNPLSTIPLISPTTQPVIHRRKVMVFPNHLISVPGLVGDVARYINHTSIKPQPILALGAALAFCGTIMGRKVRTRTDLRTNIYVIGVADSGSGKETARRAIKRLLQDANRMSMIGAEDLASDAGLFGAVYCEPSCLLLLDEVGRFWKAVTAPNAPQYKVDVATALMRFFGTADSTFPEKRKAEHGENPMRIIIQPNVCMYGTTVPGRMFESLKIADVTDGFMPRILMLHSETPDPMPQIPGDRTPDPGLIDVIRMWIARPVNAYTTGNNLADLVPNPLYVDASPEAEQQFDAFEAKNRDRRTATRGTGIDAMWARAIEHARRLALIVACGRDFDSPIIQVDDATWGCELVTAVFNRSISEIDSRVSENEQESTLKMISDYLADAGSVARSTLLRKFRNVKTTEMNAHLGRLQETDQISVALAEKAEAAAGRPALMVTWLGKE